jgi:four helix bundle protein
LNKTKTHKDLDIWKLGIELVKEIYILTKKFPASEQYCLVSQLRRCAVSIPSNIAEGAARSSKKEYIQFLYIALGSLSELETQLIISKELKYMSDSEVFEKIEKLRRKALNFIKFLKRESVNAYKR